MELTKTIKSGCRIIILSLSVFLIPRYAYGKYSTFYDNNGDTGIAYGDTIVGGYLPYYKISKVTPAIFDYLTHIYYFSLGPDTYGELGRVDNEGVFTHLTNIPTVKTDIDTLLTWRGQKSVKIYLVVGGWVQSDYFDEATADADSRANLVANIKKFCTDYGIDGVDLDWEPYNGSIDDTNYGLLISELRTTFNGTTLEISSAINPSHTSLVDEYTDADFIQLMSYGKYFSENTQVSMATLNSWVNDWINKGFSKSKLVIGLPAFGKTSSDYTALLYRDIIDWYNIPQDSDMVMHNSKTYYFNNINTIIDKTLYMLKDNLKGIMFWELGQDITVNDPRSLLRNAYETIYEQTPVTKGSNLNIGADPALYPNPVQNTMNIEFNMKEPSDITFTIYNISGKRVVHYRKYFNKGINTLPITTQHYPSGVYLLKCNLGGKAYIVKFIKI